MKKAKFFLTAAAVITMVGGAFAFNHARWSQANIYFCNSSDVCALSEYSTFKLNSLVTLPANYYFSSTNTAGISCTEGSECGSTLKSQGYINQ
jgi:hypothetical protein